jgi:hypothetical protein
LLIYGGFVVGAVINETRLYYPDWLILAGLVGIVLMLGVVFWGFPKESIPTGTDTLPKCSDTVSEMCNLPYPYLPK